jgi:hypothetical protein
VHSPALMKSVLASIVLLAFACQAWALQIDLDFTFDQTNGDFFGQHQVAKTALLKAASDIGSLINSPLGAVTQNEFVGTSGPATVTLDMYGAYQNPVTGAAGYLDPVSLSANHVTVYVGLRKLPDTTLGEGARGSAGFTYTYGGGSAAQQSTAFVNAQNAAAAVYKRGAGPVIGRISGDFNGTAVSLPYGALFGSVWFDNDTNDDNVVDDFATMNAYWHFDVTTLPLHTQNDFYSVALHEILHSIGFGTSETWDLKATGTTWSGANAKALNGGSGLNLVEDGHINQNVMSTRFYDGVAQEPVMTPSILTGTRKYLTAMDAAFLRDLNYSTIPEPASFGLLVVGAGLVLTRRWAGRRSGL